MPVAIRVADVGPQSVAISAQRCWAAVHVGSVGGQTPLSASVGGQTPPWRRAGGSDAPRRVAGTWFTRIRPTAGSVAGSATVYSPKAAGRRRSTATSASAKKRHLVPLCRRLWLRTRCSIGAAVEAQARRRPFPRRHRHRHRQAAEAQAQAQVRLEHPRRHRHRRRFRTVTRGAAARATRSADPFCRHHSLLRPRRRQLGLPSRGQRRPRTPQLAAAAADACRRRRPLAAGAAEASAPPADSADSCRRSSLLIRLPSRGRSHPRTPRKSGLEGESSTCCTLVS